MSRKSLVIFMELCQVTIVLCVNEKDQPGVMDKKWICTWSRAFHWMISIVLKRMNWAKSSLSPMLYLFGIQQTGQYLFKSVEGKMIGNFGSLNFHAHWCAEVRISTGEDRAKTVLAVSHTVNILKQISLAAAEHGIFKLFTWVYTDVLH